MHLAVLEKVTETWLFLLDVKLVFSRELSGRHKNDSLVQAIQRIDSFFAFQDTLPDSLNSWALFFAFLHVSLRNRGGGLTQGMEVHEDLVPSLSGVEVINWEI